MEKISNESKAHDLAVAYATYSATKDNETYDVNAFYQEYTQAYDHFKKIVDND